MRPGEPFEEAALLGAHGGERRFPAAEDTRRVEVDEPGKAAGRPVGDAGEDARAERVTDERHVLELLGLEVGDDVGDPRGEVDAGVVEVGAIAGPGEGDGVRVVARVPEKGRDARPHPAPEAGPRDEDDRAHDRARRSGDPAPMGIAVWQDAVMSSTGAQGPDAVGPGEAFDALLHRVVDLNKLFAAAGEALARPAGQTLARTLVLRQIAGGPVPVAEIARRLRLRRQSVQRVADLLVDDGLVTFEPNPRHRRAKLARLTAAGRATVERVDAEQRAWAQALGARVGADRLAQANALLEEILRVMRDAQEGEK